MQKPSIPRTALAFVTLLLLAGATPVSGSFIPPLASATGETSWHPSNDTRSTSSPAAIHFVLHDSPRTAPAEGTITFRYTLVNLGDTPVTVLVTAEEPLGLLHVAATPYLHVLEPLHGARGKVTVDADAALPGTYAIPVRASVQEDSRASVTRVAVLVLTPAPNPIPLHAVEVEMTPEEQHVPAGGFATLRVHVTNTGLLPATVDVHVVEPTMRLQPSPSEWTFVLAPGASATQAIWVSTSHWDAGTFTLRAKATVRENPGATSSDEATLTVGDLTPPRTGFSVEISPSSQVVYAGETAWYDVLVTSHTRANQTVSLDAYERGRTLRVTLDAGEVHLPPGASVLVRLAVETTNATEGDFDIVVDARSSEEVTLSVAARAHLAVLRLYSPTPYGVALSLGPREQTVEAGSHAVFDLKVTNTGNTTETVDLHANTSMGSLRAWVSQPSVRLAPWETVLVQLYVNTSEASAGTYRISAHATVQEAPDVTAVDHATLTVTRTEG